MMSLREAVREAARIQAQSGSRLLDLECTTPSEHVTLVYMKFAYQWHVLAFDAPRPFDRERYEQAFLIALALDAGTATIH